MTQRTGNAYLQRQWRAVVSSCGTIKLTGKHNNLTIPCQLAGGKLTLTVNGKSAAYTRTR